jgi:hypothetical protein
MYLHVKEQKEYKIVLIFNEVPTVSIIFYDDICQETRQVNNGFCRIVNGFCQRT